MNDISENLKRINENIAAAAHKSGRQAADVKLIAVTKTISSEILTKHLDVLKANGVTDLGENRVQELVEKQPALEGVNWHMIGHLQRNKVKNVVGQVSLIHSVDSLRLAEEISRVAVGRGLVADVLLEVNVAAESSKEGVAPEDTAAFAAQIAALPNISVKGLMTVAPFVTNPEENRRHFQKMAALNAQIGNLPHLSMGMTNDYVVAIEEGATMVRLGTAIFGERT